MTAEPDLIYRMAARDRVPGLPEVTGMSRATIYAKIRDGLFPPGIRLGPRMRGWPASEVRAWLDQQREAAQ